VGAGHLGAPEISLISWRVVLGRQKVGLQVRGRREGRPGDIIEDRLKLGVTQRGVMSVISVSRLCEVFEYHEANRLIVPWS